MSLEQSLLNAEIIIRLAKEHYGLDIKEVKRLPVGTANCYRLSDGQRDYFLKEFQSRFTEEDLRREAKLVDYLIFRGFPTAKIIPLADGRQYFSYSGRFVFLQEWVEGKTFGDNRLPHNLLMQSAGLLGKLHHILKDYDLPVDMGKEWICSFSPERSAGQYDELLSASEAQRNDPDYARIRDDLIYKKQLVYRIDGLSRYYSGITYCATHGDFTCFQYICNDEQIKAVIDFSSARRLPAVWEIMRSYIQSCNSCKNGAEFDTADFCEYVKRYMKFSPLTKTDLANMPYVYLYQLARSKYGYKEYLLTEAENGKDLLNFAFWRTDICREIEKKKDEISKELACLAFKEA